MGLTNMLNILVSLVSSLGEAGLKIINPNARGEETGDFGALALLDDEAKVHYHSLEPASNTANPKDVVSELKVRKKNFKKAKKPKSMPFVIFWRGSFAIHIGIICGSG